MSTNDPGTASSGPTPQAGHHPGSAGADPSQQADIEAGSTDTEHVQQSGPDTGVRESTTTSRTFRAAGLSQAREMVLREVTHLICLSTDHLWESYPLGDGVLMGVKQYLTGKHWLSEKGKWNKIDGKKITRKRFQVRSKGDGEVKTFAFFTGLFNVVLEHLRKNGHATSVKKMVHAGFVEPDSTRTSSHRPDAFLHMATKSPPAEGRFKWRELTCPFEYKFGRGDTIDVSRPGQIACRDRVLIF